MPSNKKGKVSVVVGLQFGDEGKAKIVDYLNETYDIGCRFNGSSNAGHTVVVNGQKIVFHLLPAMALRGKPCVLSPGVLVNTHKLENEIKQLNLDIKNLFIDGRCPLILDSHILDDQVKGGKIGTTGQGVGYCMSSHVLREGKRFEDFHNNAITDLSSVVLPLPTDTRKYLYDSIKNGKSVLFEGAQAFGLDIWFGTYPFVTSSSCLSGAVTTLAGIPFNMIDKVYGVFKFYVTRIGNGPFKTEIKDKQVHDKIQHAGNEFGSTTGRPRRCGWLDLPMLKEACEINGVTDLVMTKADVLDARTFSNLDLIKVYTGRTGRKEWFYYPSGLWGNLSEIKKEKDLPKSFKELLDDIEDYCNVKVSMISLGPERENIIRIK